MLADPLLTEHYAQLGFGAVLIDQQHGLLGTYNQGVLKGDQGPLTAPLPL